MIYGLLLALILGASPAHATDDNTLIPLSQTEAPAVDLLYQGKQIDQDEAAALRQQGVDLSALDPVPNDLWGGPVKGNPYPMPAEGAVIDYDSALGGFGHEISIHRVFQGEKAYRLDVSTVPHRALLTRALLHKLGYSQYAPKRYRQLTLRFPDLQKRQEFLDSLALDTVKDPKIWVSRSPKNEPTLTLQDVLLEPGSVDIQNFYWAILASNFSDGRRALRAVLAPISLCDAPENIDSYAWSATSVFSDGVRFPYPKTIESQRPFDATTIDDVRWITRKIARLSLEDWQEIVRAGDYPSDIAALVLQKLLSRRNQLVGHMGISAPSLPVNAHLSNGSVKNGQVVRAHFPGYASRFSYGSAEDPMRPEEMKKYAVMLGLTSAMETLSGKINDELVVAAANSYAKKHAQSVFRDFLQHYFQHPGEPYSQPLSVWGGPVGGFSLNATRQISTGTFFGSDAPIQLVDTVGFGGSVGYFLALDGIQNVAPSVTTGVSMGRTYSHIRPVKSISEALKVPASQFLVPKLLHDLSAILSNPHPGEGGADYSAAIEDLLTKIKDGEMFTVTDTVAGGPSAQVVIPIQALFPTAPVGYNENITFGASIQGLVSRRTTLRRVVNDGTGDNYLQVYVQSMNSLTGNVSVDLNLFVNILHIGKQQSHGQAHTRVYLVKSDSERTEEKSQVLAEGLHNLLKSNSDASLKANYPFYALEHQLDEKDSQFRFLLFQTKNLEEKHRLLLQPPAEDEHHFDPKDFERTFYSYRKLSRSGSNFISLLSDSVSAATKGGVNVAAGNGSNPAYTPYGSAHWTETYSDAELTKGAKLQPVTISREVWAGWEIANKKLQKVFDQIDKGIGSLKKLGVRVPLIHRNTFAATQKLELYNITATTIFYPKGVQRILSALFPKVKKEKPSFFKRLMRGGSYDEFSAGDKAVFATLNSWFGGANAYFQSCKKLDTNTNARDHDSGSMPTYMGNTYSCLTPWMIEVLKLRRSAPDPKTEKEAWIEWQTRVMEQLVKGIPSARLMKVARKDGFFFQVQVNGFRKGDHQAKDSELEELIASYVSDTVGTVDQDMGGGAFNDMASKTGITNYELSALFFTGGD